MGAVELLALIGFPLAVGLLGRWIAVELGVWHDPICNYLIRRAAKRLPGEHQASSEAEWLAIIRDIRSPTSQLAHAIHLYLLAGRAREAFEEAAHKTSRRQRFSSNAVLSLIAFLSAEYIRLLGLTNRILRWPQDNFYQPFHDNEGVIVALWHGQHFLVPWIVPGGKLNILVATNRDGEIVARGSRFFGLNCIRCPARPGGRELSAVLAFNSMRRRLQAGESVLMTADVPKVARVASLGIVTLAKHAQRPIVPVAMATSRRVEFDNWDRSCIGLPFGRMAIVRGDPVFVAPDADHAALEAARLRVEELLNSATERAYALVDRNPDVEAIAG